VTAALPIRIGDLSLEQFRSRLRGTGLGIRIGPFDVRLVANVRGLDEPLRRLYRDYPLLECGQVLSCHLALRDIWRFRPRPGRYVRFAVDGRVPHEDLPSEQALAVFEWGLNLVIALRMHCFLMLHSAVLERNGRALVLPAAPGSGKTTLCAALAERGWRLLSDEFGLLRPGTIDFVPVPRPMPLKNESIEVMRAFVPGLELGPIIPRTRKGTVAHVRPPADSVRRQHEVASVRWLVFPEWQAGASLSLQEIPQAEGFMRLATNAFNYEVLGIAGFATVREVVNASRCFRLSYSNLDEAVAQLTALADNDDGG
jgi:HprK-related kinase A